jgi:hypothetical protein
LSGIENKKEESYELSHQSALPPHSARFDCGCTERLCNINHSKYFKKETQMDPLTRQKKMKKIVLDSDTDDVTTVIKPGAGDFSRLGRMIGFLFFLSIGFFAACSHNDAKDAKDEAEDAQAVQQATAGAASSVGGTSKSAIGAVGRAGGNSSATNTILKALGLPENADPDPTSDLEEQLGDAIAAIFENGVRTGSTITFNPDETELCDDPLLGQISLLVGVNVTGPGDPQQPCIDFYSHITVVLTPGDTSEEGTLDIKYDNLTLATIAFSPGSFSIQFDLAQLKAISSAARPDVDLPETIEGVVKTTFTELGPDHARVTFSIEQEINVVDSEDDFDITIAAAPKVFEFTANGPEGTIVAELGLGALAAMFPVEDATGANSFPTNLNLSAATLHAELTAESLVITNFGIGGAPFTLDSTGNPGVDFSFAFDTFGVTVDETGLTFDQAYNSTFEIADSSGLFSSGLTGTVDVAVPQESAWTVVGSVFDNFFNENVPLVQVASAPGSATVNGTGAFGSEDIAAGECFTLRPSFGFPLVSANCP